MILSRTDESYAFIFLIIGVIMFFVGVIHVNGIITFNDSLVTLANPMLFIWGGLILIIISTVVIVKERRDDFL